MVGDTRFCARIETAPDNSINATGDGDKTKVF
jgi:hypothetical protein